MIVWPGLRRFISTVQRLFNSASFSAPLTHSLVLDRGTGSPTFTRATTATVRDNEGVLRTAIAGEARFEGARRVRNILGVTSSESLIAGGWSNSLGAITATTATYTALGNQLYATVGGSAPAVGTKFCVQIKLSGTQGNKINLYMMNGAATSGSGVQITLTTTPTVYSVTGTVSNSSQHYLWLMSASYLGVPAGTASQVVAVTNAQAEDVTAQTTQTAGEYVSVGVASSPYYHGSMVDGVKCFATDINGAAIPSTTLLGYVAEGARTNLCLQSNAFTTTWTETGTVAATQNLVGPDGGTTGWTLTDNDAGTPEGILQTYGALTAANYAQSIFIKKTSGATSFPVIRLNEPVTPKEALCTVDTNNGIATVWTAYTGSTIVTSSASCVSHNADWWRVTLVFAATTASWRTIFYPAATTNATQATGTVSAAVTGTCGIYGSQLELGSFASSYIPTTTIAVTRNADVLTYSSAGNIDGTKGWCYAEISADWDTPPPSNYCAMGFGTSIEGLITGSVAGLPTEIRAFDGTNSAQQSGNPTMYRTPRNTAVTWGGSSMSVGQSGVVTAGSFDGNIGTTAIGVGNSGAGAFQWFGTIRDVRIGQRQLSASEMQAITA